jgi:hypothetical protein
MYNDRKIIEKLKMKNCIKNITNRMNSQHKGFQGVAIWASDPDRS